MAKAKRNKTDSAAAAQESKAVVVTEPFEVGGKKYLFAYPKINIPGVGVRTSLECVLDDQTNDALDGLTILEHLVKIGSGAINEV